MKKSLKLLLLLTAFCSMQDILAQDSLYLTDGSALVVKVLEIETNVVRYKKYTNLHGPTYTLETAKIMRIKFVNGDEESFQIVPSIPIKHMVTVEPDLPLRPLKRSNVFIKIEPDELPGLSSEVKNFMNDWKYFDVVFSAEDADFILQITTLKKGMTFWSNTSVSSKALMQSTSGVVLWESAYYKSTSSLYNGYNSLHGSLKKLFNNGLKKKYN